MLQNGVLMQITVSKITEIDHDNTQYFTFKLAKVALTSKKAHIRKVIQ